jgi:hypothetical protein
MGIFPLTFLSNVFVDPTTLPGPLEAFVAVNPISILATASRGLMEGNADGTDIAIVLGIAVALTAVFAPLTTRLYRRADPRHRARDKLPTMTERKPAGVSFESWVERQLREARDRGSFDDLPGTGKPLQPASFDELAWVREKLRREDLPVSALLAPALAVAKEVEDLPTGLARERSEARVRAIVADVNGRIDAARRGPQVGPPVRTRFVDVEAAVAAWREAVAARSTPPPPTPAHVEAACSRWSRLRRGRRT